MNNATSQAPPGLKLPDCEPRDFVLEENQSEMYWACYGEKEEHKVPFWRHFQKRDKEPPDDIAVFETADEAEAHASGAHTIGWVWDKQPASQKPLQDYIDGARRSGRHGVRLIKYDHGQGSWVVIKQWLSGVPLQ